VKLRIIPHKRANAAWNLALEEALFLRAKQDLLKGKPVQPIVKLYSFPKPTVVLGYMQKISEIDKEYCDSNSVHVTMRTTGGGSVYLGKEDLQYSLLLPVDYSKELLKQINTDIVHASQDVGFSPDLVMKTGHPVVRLKGRGFIFDAQRRFKDLLLHHGTALIDNFDYEHMPDALRATSEELEVLKTGNVWLRNEAEVKERALIKAFEKNFSGRVSIIRKDFTNAEIKLARKLYNNFYTNVKEISSGKKESGICYKTDSLYDMEKYAEDDEE